MRNEKIILTDCDGVCLDWEFAFHQWMESHGHMLLDARDYQVTNMYGINKDVAKTLVRTFNESAAIGFLPPLRDAQYYIKLLHEKHQYKFIAITSLSLDPHAIKLRERNLAKLFGPNTFKEIVCLDCGADKDEVLKEYGQKYPWHWWIEDKPENVDKGIEHGLLGMLMKHGHNLEYKGIAKTMLNWEHIYNHIIQEDQNQ